MLPSANLKRRIERSKYDVVVFKKKNVPSMDVVSTNPQ